MAKFLDYNPMTGVEQLEDNYDGHLQIHYRQDVEPVLDLAAYERNNGLADKVGRESKQDLYLYARIPQVTVLEMKHKHGLDLYNRNHLKRIMELIERDYPKLKCTEKKHFLKQ